MLTYAPYPGTLGFVGAAVRDRLLPGEELAQGQELRTSNGGRLVMQTDGNLVLYAPPNLTPIWATDTAGKPVTRAVFQKDGNLVMRSPPGYGGVPEGRGWWDSGTKDRGVTQLVFQTDGNLVWYKGEAAAQNAVSNTGTHNWAKSPNWQKDDSNFFKDVVNVVTAPVTAVTHAVTTVAHAVEQVPVIGDVVHIIDEVNATPFRFVGAIASGARIDHAVVGELKNQLKIVKEAAPYAQTVVALVPGVGTGVAAAIAAGAALAEGQNITEIGKAAIRGALPGGAIAAAAFDTALKAASGENIVQSVLESARNAIPSGVAQKAYDIGLAVATGEKLQTALAKGLVSMAPSQLNTIIAAGEKALTATPGLSSALSSVTSAAGTQGFKLAAGLLSQSGMNEKALTAVRSQLPADIRQGFDTALKTQEGRVTWLKNVTSAPVVATRAPTVLEPPKKAVPATWAPKVLEPPKPAVQAPKVLEPPKKSVAAPATQAPKVLEPPKPATVAPKVLEPSKIARLAGKYGPYPKTIGLSAPPLGVGFTWGSDSRWRWFTVRANGRPIAQRGPIWLSDSGAQREAESFLEATLGRAYIGAVTRWDWDGQAWHQAPSSGLGAPPHHGGGHPHPHGGHGGGHPRIFRGSRDVPGWWGEYYPLPAEVVTTTETCRTWGDLVPIPPSMVQAVKTAIGSSGGRPTTMRGDDGTLYLFTVEGGGIAARPCAAVGVGGWWSDAWNDWSSEVKDLWRGTAGVGAAQDKSPLDFTWFAFDFYDKNGNVVGRWGPFWANVGAMSLLTITGLTTLSATTAAQRIGSMAFGFGIQGAVRADVWIYEASHDDPSKNIWRIFTRTVSE